jgi:Spy/CpxP family protein refolding chaperone
MANELIRPSLTRLAGPLTAACLAVLLLATGCSGKPADVAQSSAQAQPAGTAGAPGSAGARGNARFGKVLQRLDLSDTQKEQIRTIMKDARTQARGTTDTGQRRAAMRAAFAKVQDVLTPAQRDAFKAKMQELRNSSPAPAAAQ